MFLSTDNTRNFSAGQSTDHYNHQDLGRLPYPLEATGIESSNLDGSIFRLGRWKVAVVAVVDDIDGKRRYVPSNRIHNGLNPQEKGCGFLEKLNQYRNNWQLVYVNGHVYVWPKMKAAGLDPAVAA